MQPVVTLRSSDSACEIDARSHQREGSGAPTTTFQGREVGRVVVAMSGGVDSSVSALLLGEAGVDALGVSMQVWDYKKNGGCASKATCCAPSDFLDARRAAGLASIPYYVFDFEKQFRAQVIDPFVASYEAGFTPNPCIDCNNKVKFGALRARAMSLGCSHVATGHYARIERAQSEGEWALLRGLDNAKDQSYFLYEMTQADLASTLFPVGAMNKTEVRAYAESRGLSSAQKSESQDICFVTNGVKEFLKAASQGVQKPGPIVTSSGEVVGEHQGIRGFTVGQRRGLGIGGSSEALYVTGIDSATRTVVVGPKKELELESFLVSGVNLIDSALAEELARHEEAPHQWGAPQVLVQVRHRHPGIPVSLKSVKLDGEDADDSRRDIECTFLSEHATVAPGQAAVFYDLESNQRVLGGGRIRTLGRCQTRSGRLLPIV